MRSLILIAPLALALGACQAKEETKPAAPADTTAAKSDAAAPAAAAPTTLATMPTAALAGEQAVAAQKSRHDKFEAMGDAMKALSREARAATPDMTVVKTNAAVLVNSSAELPGWFAPGTGPEAGKTEAKAEIWKTPDDFAAKAKAFHEAAPQLAAATDGAAFKAAMDPVGKACKSCHDSYRAED